MFFKAMLGLVLGLNIELFDVFLLVVFCHRLLIEFTLRLVLFLNDFLMWSRVWKHKKCSFQVAGAIMDFLCFVSLDTLRIHCYLQYILKVRMLTVTYVGMKKQSKNDQTTMSEFIKHVVKSKLEMCMIF